MCDFGDHSVVREGLFLYAAEMPLCTSLTPCFSLADHQKFAVLSQRLPLGIKSMEYVASPVVDKVHTQISNNMAVCVSIGEGFETIRNVAVSEPMNLSEAASFVMRTSALFQLADGLGEFLSEFTISPGDRAELLVSAFFTWARDEVLVVETKSIPQG